MAARTHAAALVGALVLLSAPAPAQKLMRAESGDDVRIGVPDLAVFAAGEPRDDLPCKVEILDPKLEYDLNFQAGYVARVPLAWLAGSGNSLRILVRVKPEGSDAEPRYFRDSFSVPAIPEGAAGEATLPGKLRLGPGRYKIDWLMRDRAERVCARSWEAKAETVEGFEKLASPADSLVVAEWSDEIFYDEPPVRRAPGRLLSAKLLVSFSPVDLTKVKLGDYDLRGVVSMLRAIAREPRIGRFSVVAYNAHEERVFLETGPEPRVDFRALGEAVRSSYSGRVNIEQLQDKRSGEKFLASLLERHLTRAGAAAAGEDEPPDLVIFLGPKVVFERPATNALVNASARLPSSLFYFVYNNNPRSYPWRDALSVGLKNLPVVEYDVTGPKEFGRAMRQFVEALGRMIEPGS